VPDVGATWDAVTGWGSIDVSLISDFFVDDVTLNVS
jgi:hypothetical protein